MDLGSEHCVLDLSARGAPAATLVMAIRFVMSLLASGEAVLLQLQSYFGRAARCAWPNASATHVSGLPRRSYWFALVRASSQFGPGKLAAEA